MTLQRLVLDFRSGELVTRVLYRSSDAELERLISKRASQEMRPDPGEQEERWKASVRAYSARQQEENRQAWCEYHRGQAARHKAVLETLIASLSASASWLASIQGGGR